MHTFTLNSYTTILKMYGIVESDSKAFGLNRTGAMRDWGMRTMDSALQILLYQLLLEEYGGEHWNSGTLPPPVKSWISTLKTGSKNDLESDIRNGISWSEAVNRAMGRAGAKAANDVKLAKSIQKAISGGPFRLTHHKPHAEPRAHLYAMGERITVDHSCAKLGDEVMVNSIISDGAHPLRFAKNALNVDPGRRLAILVTGHTQEGIEWHHYCRIEGPKAAMRANTMFDLLTGTGTAISEEKILRRSYRVRTGKIYGGSGNYAYRTEYSSDKTGSEGLDEPEDISRAEYAELQHDLFLRSMLALCKMRVSSELVSPGLSWTNSRPAVPI